MKFVIAKSKSSESECRVLRRNLKYGRTPLLVGLSIAAASQVFAANAEAASFVAVEDASANRDKPNEVYGKASKLETDGSPAKEAFLKFKVQGLSGSVTSAKLRLYVTNSSKNGPSIYFTPTDWSESSLTWNDRPARSSGSLDGKGKISSGTWIEYDLSSQISGDGLYSFLLAQSDGDGADFASRESSNPPVLVISTNGGSAPSPTQAPATPRPTVAPTATPKASATPVPSTSMLSNSSPAYQSKAIPSQSGSFVAQFTLVPLTNNANAVTMLAGKAVSNYSDAAMLVRLNSSGKIDVRNGSSYRALASLAYSANKRYRVRIDGNVSTRRYSVSVTPEGGSAVQLAKDYAFRSEQASVSAINNLAAVAESGSHQVLDFSISGSSVSPTATPKPTTSPTSTPKPTVAPTATPKPTATPAPVNGDPSANFQMTPIYDQDQVINGVAYSVHSAEQEHSIRKSKNGGVYDFEVHKGEGRPGKDPERDRSELNGGTDLKFNESQGIWVSYSFLYEKGNSWSDISTVFGQWHAGLASPVVSFKMSSDKTFFVRLIGGSSSNNTKTYPYEDKNFEPGKWYNIVLYTKFGPSGNGIFRLWIDGKKVVDMSNAKMGYSDYKGYYWKMGIYRDPTSVVMSARFANMEISTSSLEGRVTNPLPIKE